MAWFTIRVTLFVKYAICALNGKIYVFGGESLDGIPISTVVEYDPTTDKWTKMPDMPIARVFSSASVVNGKAYIMGGSTESTTVEEYTPEDLQISAISPQGKLPALWGDLKSKWCSEDLWHVTSDEKM